MGQKKSSIQRLPAWTWTKTASEELDALWESTKGTEWEWAVRRYREAHLGMVPSDEEVHRPKGIIVAEPCSRPCVFLSETLRESEETGIPKGVTEVCAHPNHRTLILLRKAILLSIEEMKQHLERATDGLIIQPISATDGLIIQPISAEEKLQRVCSGFSNTLDHLTRMLSQLDIMAAGSDDGEMTGGFREKPKPRSRRDLSGGVVKLDARIPGPVQGGPVPQDPEPVKRRKRVFDSFSQEIIGRPFEPFDKVSGEPMTTDAVDLITLLKGDK